MQEVREGILPCPNVEATGERSTVLSILQKQKGGQGVHWLYGQNQQKKLAGPFSCICPHLLLPGRQTVGAISPGWRPRASTLHPDRKNYKVSEPLRGSYTRSKGVTLFHLP